MSHSTMRDSLPTSTKCQPCNTNARYAPTNDAHSSGAKSLIYLVPGKARPDLDGPIIRIDFCGVEA